MYIERDITEQFKKIVPVYPIIALVGARQSGKTTFLKNQSKGAIYLLFDDPDIRKLFDDNIKDFERQYLKENEIAILDEVQYAKDPGQKLKYLADTDKKLWITASSEIMLSKKVLSYLVGRVSILRLYPFNCKEFLTLKNIRVDNPELIKREIEEHAIYGGYPKVATTADTELKKTILRDLYETMVLKDIAKTFSIQDLDSLEKFTQYLAINSGSQLSYETITQTIGLSFHSIKKYLNAMEKSYFIITIKPYFTNKNKELSKQPKIYLLDTGLRNSITKTFIIDGKIFENYVVAELVKAGFNPQYWRTKTKAEVDFIIEKNGEVIPIEVKLTAEKVEKSMRAFIEVYHPKRAYIVTHHGEDRKIKINGCEIKIITITTLIDELHNLN